MGGMRKFMPTTYKTFIICTIALMGLPPLAGFWSKDEILVGTGGWGLFGGTGGNGSYVFALVMGIIGRTYLRLHDQSHIPNILR